MDSAMRRVLLHILVVLVAYAIGLLFHPFWLSSWGPYTFVFLTWLASSIILTFPGGGKPYSMSFGVICGSGIAVSLLVTMYTNGYVGMAALVALIYAGFKTGFFARRTDELR